MLAIHCQHPALIHSCLQFSLKPSPTVADTSSGALTEARSSSELNGSNRLRITNIAKNKLSDGHNVDFKKLSNE
jgi:hypothetical protein